jgi:hypothetical protein
MHSTARQGCPTIKKSPGLTSPVFLTDARGKKQVIGPKKQIEASSMMITFEN